MTSEENKMRLQIPCSPFTIYRVQGFKMNLYDPLCPLSLTLKESPHNF